MLDAWRVVVVFGAVVIGLIAVMMAFPLLGVMAKAELAPEEDQGFMFYIGTGAPNASIEQMATYQHQAFRP